MAMPGAGPAPGRPRRRALLVLGGAAAAAAYLFAPVKSFSQAGGLSAFAFAGTVPRAAAAAPRGHVALRAEEVDAEVAGGADEEEKKVTSVFDGPVTGTFKSRFNHVNYIVDRSTWKYTVENEDMTEGEKGDWAREWNMPQKEFKKRERSLKQKWRAKKRKLRIRHGEGQRWPNGRLIFLSKLNGSPFTRERHGEKYTKKAPWLYSPNEVPARERQMRALALKRRLEQEAEETRVKRLQELGVWPGRQAWRRPWQPKVDLTPNTLRSRV